MSLSRAAILLVAIAIMGTAGWLILAPPADGAPAPAADDKGVTPVGIDAVVQGNNRFALKLYSKLAAQPGNIFCSPFSISTALAMTYEGARAKTADEIATVFHFPTDLQTRRSGFASLHNQLNRGAKEYQLSVANALWSQQDYPFLPEYLKTVEQFYASEASSVDFRHAAEPARKRINAWVEDRTNDKIQDLFAAGSLDANTRLVLTNAIYFKGNWTRQFDKAQTKDDDFTTAGGKKVQVPLMRQTGEDAKFGYAETPELQLLELPYAGDKLSMLVLLPRKVDGLPALEQSLTPEALTAWRKQLATRQVNAYLPKFKLATKYELNPTLSALGMPAAFAPGADFSGMDGTHDLYLQLVIHQAFVDVNEEGTEAAAATGVAVRATSAINPASIPTFRADHPFLFAILDREHGALLFLGRVENPQS